MLTETQMASRKYDFFFLKLKFMQENEVRKPKVDRETKPCGKIKYESMADLRVRVNGIEKREKGKEVRGVYYCKHCQAYHFSRERKRK